MKISQMVAILGWISFFAMSWAVILGKASQTIISVLFLFLFLLIALGASSFSSNHKYTKDK